MRGHRLRLPHGRHGVPGHVRHPGHRHAAVARPGDIEPEVETGLGGEHRGPDTGQGPFPRAEQPPHHEHDEEPGTVRPPRRRRPGGEPVPGGSQQHTHRGEHRGAQTPNRRGSAHGDGSSHAPLPPLSPMAVSGQLISGSWVGTGVRGGVFRGTGWGRMPGCEASAAAARPPPSVRRPAPAKERPRAAPCRGGCRWPRCRRGRSARRRRTGRRCRGRGGRVRRGRGPRRGATGAMSIWPRVSRTTKPVAGNTPAVPVSSAGRATATTANPTAISDSPAVMDRRGSSRSPPTG